MRFLAQVTVAALASLAGFQASSHPLSAPVREAVVAAGEWHSGCPVTLSQLRVLRVPYVGFDGHSHTGELIVNQAAVAPLTTVFRRLYAMRFPIRHMQLSDTYGPARGRPADGDFTASFECRQASASPCTSFANKGTGSWSEHAYGEAVDINPIENPYTGCGRTRVRASIPYLNRSHRRPGMVNSGVIRAFASIGWGWGGNWSGTKDYMHFSATGH